MAINSKLIINGDVSYGLISSRYDTLNGIMIKMCKSLNNYGLLSLFFHCILMSLDQLLKNFKGLVVIGASESGSDGATVVYHDKIVTVEPVRIKCKP
jgi:hypothetical protein